MRLNLAVKHMAVTIKNHAGVKSSKCTPFLNTPFYCKENTTLNYRFKIVKLLIKPSLLYIM